MLEGEECGVPLQKEEVWGKVGHTEKARQVLSNELIRALDAPLAAHLNEEGGDDHGSKSQSAQALKDRHSLQADLTGSYSCSLTSLSGFYCLKSLPRDAPETVCCCSSQGFQAVSY